MLHQSYFESRNALIHYIILRKKDMYSFVYSHVEKSISLNTNAVLYLETFFFLRQTTRVYSTVKFLRV